MKHFFQFPLVLGPKGTGVAQEFRLEAREPRFERFGHGCLLGQKSGDELRLELQALKNPGVNPG